MVFPVMAAAALGSSLIGAVVGNKNAKKQIKLQEEANANQKAYNEQSIALAKEAQRIGLATQIDENGNLSVYDSATNTWKVVLSPEQDQLNDSSNKEQLAQYTDAASSRNQRQEQAGIRSQENDTAATQREQFNRTAAGGGQDPTRLASALSLARTEAVNNGFDSAQRGVNTQALRSGATGMAGAASALGRARSQTLAEARGNPEIEGLQMADQMNNNNLGAAADRYNMFATRGANIDNVAMNPSGVGSALSGALAGQKQLAMQGAQGSANAAANAGRFKPDIPDYNSTNFWGGLSDLIAAPGTGDLLGKVGTAFKKPTFQKVNELDGF